MVAGVRDVDHGYRDLVKRVFGLQRSRIAVGILTDEARADDSALTLLQVAIWNHFGTTDPVTGEVHVPARPFITGWFDANEDRLRRLLFFLLQDVVKGKRTKEQVLEMVGQRAVGEIQAYIAQGVPPPNAPSTVRKKGSSTPLIGKTGQLRAGVTYKVDPG